VRHLPSAQARDDRDTVAGAIGRSSQSGLLTDSSVRAVRDLMGQPFLPLVRMTGKRAANKKAGTGGLSASKRWSVQETRGLVTGAGGGCAAVVEV
jgi:hypothetical protein